MINAIRTAALAVSIACIALPASAAGARQEYPYPRDAVFAALVQSIPALGYKIKEQDQVIARVVASAGISASSWGERLSFAVIETGPGKAAIEYQSNRKMGANVLDGGRGYKIFDKIVMDVSKRLQAGGQPTASDPLP